MRLFEGTISDLPAQPSTGFVALLAKHRAAIDPSFNLRAGKLALHALARAIIEALGGKPGKDGWEVDLSVFDLDVTIGEASQKVEALQGDVTQLQELFNLLEDAVKQQEQKIKDLTAQLQGTQAQYQSLATLQAETLSRLEKLENPAPRKRAQKSEEAPTE